MRRDRNIALFGFNIGVFGVGFRGIVNFVHRDRSAHAAGAGSRNVAGQSKDVGAAFGFDFNIIGTDEFAAVNFRIADIGRRPVADLVDRHCAGNGNAGFAERAGSAFRRSDNFAG